VSEPKLISPLLDNFAMGDPVSNHHGVQCCPAIHNETASKYIVKIISVPASAAQLDALLLSGAYTDKQQALIYFQDLANDISAEVQALEALSKLEGFENYEAHQIVPKEDGSGYNVYLLSTYRKSLAKLLKTSTLTHLAALNLGLDLCAALSVCRRSGYLFVDLKPENIFYTQEQGFKIGDIGLIRMDALKYASLPERYRSQYTAPEISDAFSSLNTTVDIYALGLILLQVFNGGVLPKIPDNSSEPYPAPDYADYEISEIILKACNPNPAERWQDPAEMGQALVSYMQRNGAHDSPIVPIIEQPESPVDEEPETSTEQAVPEDTEQVESGDAPTQEDANEEASVDEESLTYSEDENGNLTFMLSADEDETVPSQEDAQVDYSELSNEMTDMLTQADDLISHPTPEPVVAPEPIDVPLPPPLPLEEITDDFGDTAVADTDQPIDTSKIDEIEEVPAEEVSASVVAAADADDEDCDASVITLETAPKKKHWLRNLLIAVFSLAVIAGGVLFYSFYYLQSIDSLVLHGATSKLTVYVTTDVPNEKLTVVCSDTYGNKLTQPVVGGAAKFENLKPGTPYTVDVEISGFHKLIGDVQRKYTTPDVTTVSQFVAKTGQEDGSVILTFNTEGPGSTQWKVSYGINGNNLSEEIFTGQKLTLTGLAVGKDYTFSLSPIDKIYVVGELEITHTVSNLILAENLTVTGCMNGVLSAQWKSPADISGTQWTVRCFNAKGYDKTIVTDQLSATFEGIIDSDSYTVEVIASGMSRGERAEVAEHSTTITDFSVDTGSDGYLNLHWNRGNAAEDQKWIVRYTVGSAPVCDVVADSDCSASIPLIPSATYDITLLTDSEEPVLGGLLTFTAPAAESFNKYGVQAAYIQFNMCLTPNNANWDRWDVKEYTTTFKIGQNASFVARLRKEYNTSSDVITTLYVITNDQGNIVNYYIESATWRSMWYNSYGEFDIPSLPTTPGNYTVYIYFNADLAGNISFNITE